MNCECLIDGFCQRRQCRVAPSLHRLCQAGQGDQVDDVLKTIAARRLMPKEPVAPTSTTSNVGTRIRLSLESRAECGRLSGDCRRYLAKLNEPQYYDVAVIVHRLVHDVAIDADVVTKIVTDAMAVEGVENPNAVKHGTSLDVSDVGTRLREAIEFDGGYKLTCGYCINYLRSLNQSTAHDTDAIVLALKWELQIPAQLRGQPDERGLREAWLRAIVERVISEAS